MQPPFFLVSRLLESTWLNQYNWYENLLCIYFYFSHNNTTDTLLHSGSLWSNHLDLHLVITYLKHGTANWTICHWKEVVKSTDLHWPCMRNSSITTILSTNPKLAHQKVKEVLVSRNEIKRKNLVYCIKLTESLEKTPRWICCIMNVTFLYSVAYMLYLILLRFWRKW